MNWTSFYPAIFGICLVLSFLFAGMESGVFALSRWRIRQQVRQGNRRAQVLQRYLENPENFIWTILVGNVVATFGGMTLAAVFIFHSLKDQPVFALVLFFAALLLYFALCDLLPKMLFGAFPNRLCMGLAGPFRLVYVVLAPVVSVLEWFSNVLLSWTGGRAFSGHVFTSRRELRMLMAEPAQGLTTEERAMINRVLDIENLTVRQILLPFGRFPRAHLQMKVTEALELYRHFHGAFLPVWDQNRIAGVLNFKRVLYDESSLSRPLADFVQSALYLNEDVRVEDALRRMQRAGQRLAIVLGLDRKELGVISLEEILKVIFGEVKL